MGTFTIGDTTQDLSSQDDTSPTPYTGGQPDYTNEYIAERILAKTKATNTNNQQIRNLVRNLSEAVRLNLPMFLEKFLNNFNYLFSQMTSFAVDYDTSPQISDSNVSNDVNIYLSIKASLLALTPIKIVSDDANQQLKFDFSPTAKVSFNNQIITNVGNPTLPNDAVNLTTLNTNNQ